MKINDFKQKFIYICIIGVSIFLLFFVVSCCWIGYEVKSRCQEAEREYGGSCTEALINVLKDEKKSYRQRNSAVWALGQLGDSQALPILQSYYNTGNIPNRESLDKVISQYELKKAVNLTSGGLNITAIFWRYNLD